MADQNTNHEHGSMDISDQEKTFAAFIKYSTWVAVVAIATLIFMYAVNG